jgi:5-methyltetrahydropteroyltriglutamate--homocysteine methyltransferase
MSKIINTAIAGSLPKPAWLAEPEKLWAPWQLQGEALAQAKIDAMRLSVDDQLRAGISVIGDGEQTRQHFVTTFIDSLKGVDFVNRKTVRIRNRYDADVPVVVDRVSRGGPVFVEDAKRLRMLTKGPIKFTLPGPMTMIDTLYDDYYHSREKLAWTFAEILNEEAKDLAAVGVDVVQFDEPAFNVYFDEVRDWGVNTLERAAQGLTCKSAVHICYGYGIEANIKWKQSLGDEWRQYEKIFPALAKSSIDQVSLECFHSHVPMDLIALLEGKDVMVGVIDVASDTIETPEEVAETIGKALKFVNKDRLFPCTNCGLAPMSREVALKKLEALAKGAALARERV